MVAKFVGLGYQNRCNDSKNW